MEEENSPEKTNGLLAEALFGEAFFENAIKHLEKAKEDFQRGALDQAIESLRRLSLNLPQALTRLTSPKLSESENKEWLELQKMKYKVGERGYISQRRLNDYQEERLRYFNERAFKKD